MVLGALAALLEIEGDISVVGQARNGKEALEAVLAHKPDVFITDIEMPHMSGLDVAAELKRRKTGTRVVIVTTFARAGYLRRALEAGASGYLLKDMRAEELADAVRRVHQGLRVIHPELATEAWAEMDPLTDRERQVLRLRRRRHGQRRHRRRAGPLRRHRAKLSLRSHQQTRRQQPRRSRANRENQRLAINVGRTRPSTLLRAGSVRRLPGSRRGLALAITSFEKSISAVGTPAGVPSASLRTGPRHITYCILARSIPASSFFTVL